MHLTPKQRIDIVQIYYSLDKDHPKNLAKATSIIAAERRIFISEQSVRMIIRKWISKSIFLKIS